MEGLLICVLCTLAHVPSLVLRYLPFSGLLERRRRNLLLTLYSAALLLNGLTYAWLLRQNLLTIAFYKMNLLVFCMFLAMVNIIVIHGYLQEHLFTFGLVAILVLMMTAMSAFVADRIGYADVNKGLILSNVVFLLSFLLLYLPLKQLLTRTITPFLNLEDRAYWNTIWFVPTAMFLASLLSISVDAYTNNVQQLISKLMIGIATLFICRSIAQDYERMRENEFLNQQVDEQKQYYRAISEKMKLEQEARHNYKHHIAAMKGFLDHSDVQGLKKYLSQFMEVQDAEIKVPHSGNAAVDGILLHYARIAEAKKIDFESQCSFPDGEVPELDLCNLLGNALDNAVTAAEGGWKADQERGQKADQESGQKIHQKSGRPWIRISSEIDGDMLLITVSNSFDGLVTMKHDKILSRKRVMQEGIGIYTMKNICKKYDGACRFTWEGDEFFTDFMLMLNPK